MVDRVALAEKIENLESQLQVFVYPGETEIFEQLKSLLLGDIICIS